MTPRPSDLPARLLPVRVRPFPQETVGSYTRRLASANHLPFAEFLDHLADNQAAQRPTLIRSHELRLNQPAIGRLAAFSGMPAAALRRALPGLTAGSPGPRPLRSWATLSHRNRPVRACPCCAARTGGGEILLYQPLHQTICLSHDRWLAGRDDNRSVDLTLFPEVIQAARRHIRLTRRREPSVLKHGYRQANEIAQDWFDRSSFLTPVWHERYDRIGATRAYGARVITYPETVGLTSLLSSPHWTRLLQRGDYHLAIPAFLREAGRRIGHPYPANPRNDPLRYWAVSQWAGTASREPGHIDW
jgi:TniQ